MRIKRGTTKKKAHKKVLKQAKGYRLSYHRLYRRAKEATLHAGQYNYNHRKKRPAQMRREWIKIISASLYGSGLSYSEFINQLKNKNIELDRKVLAEVAGSNPEHFKQLIAEVS